MMTETTDIKALREALAASTDFVNAEITTGGKADLQMWLDVVYPEFTAKIIKELIELRDQLEAERQQREAAERVASARLTAIDSTHKNRVMWRDRAEKSEAELAALRGTQEPVGKFAGWGLYCAETDEFGSWLYSRPRKDTDDAITQHGYVNVELFTHPPKPVVVLPKRHLGIVQNGHAVMVPYSGGHWLNKTAVIESLEAAGIVVKDGE